MDAARVAAIPLFADLGASERELAARWADEVEVAPGRQLVAQGDSAYEFFVITEGTAEVVRDGTTVAELGPGDFFGEIALLETERRNATVTAITPMRVIVMTRDRFQQLMRSSPELAGKLAAAVRARL
jgi:voltage-gated potassium channel